MIYSLPDEESIHDMLSLMFGDNMSVSSSTEIDYENTYAAVYVSPEGETGAVCVCDISFAAYSSGALTMMPPAVIEEAISSNELSEMHLANLYEVMNICTRLVINDETAHLKLTKVVRVEEVAQEIDAVKSGAERKDFAVSIPRYGTGTMSFIVT